MKDFFVTKRQQVLNMIEPYLEIFNINGEYRINGDTLEETLVLNGQKIRCTGENISGIFDKFIAYLFVKFYFKRRKPTKKEQELINKIKADWLD